MKLNADIAAFSVDADLDPEIEMGKLLQGSELPDPETTTEDYLSGHKTETGATIDGLLRIDGIGHDWLATLQEAKSPANGDAPSDVWIIVYNRARTLRTVYGPCKVHAAFEKGAGGEPSVTSTIVRFNAAGDAAEDIIVTEAVPPAAPTG